MEFCLRQNSGGYRFGHGVLREAQNSGNNCRMAAIVQTPAGIAAGGLKPRGGLSMEFCGGKLVLR
jgi:hypothetical protein